MTDLAYVFDGWSGYNESLVRAMQGLTIDQLRFRGPSKMRSIEEVAWHIADGRVEWFARMDAPGAAELFDRVCAREEKVPENADASQLCAWLEETWKIVEGVLNKWSIESLTQSFRQPYGDKVYAVSRQWVIFRILLHDVHHGGQISELLTMQGLEPEELTLLGGHIVFPPETN